MPGGEGIIIEILRRSMLPRPLNPDQVKKKNCLLSYLVPDKKTVIGYVVFINLIHIHIFSDYNKSTYITNPTPNKS